jgi:DNA-binding CsgD family transcriptional regulator
MAVWNVPLTPDRFGNPGLSLFPSDTWPLLGSALRLSAREVQIVQGVFEDRKEVSIAYELGISPHTVNTYFQRLYSKLRVSSRPQLIVRVMAEYLTMSSAQATDEDPAWRNTAAGAM